VRDAVRSVRGLQSELVHHLDARQRGIAQDLAGLGTQLEDLLQMAGFNGEQAVKNVIKLAEQALFSDDALQRSVDEEVQPQTEQWRRGVGQVLDHFDSGVDYDGIMATAEETYARESQLAASVVSAGDEVNSFMRKAEGLSHKLMAAEEMKLAETIGRILRRGDLETGEKIARIRAAKTDAAKMRDVIAEKARLIAASQHGTDMSVDQQRSLLGELVERARSTLDASLNPPAPVELEIHRGKVITSMEQAQDALKESFLQLSSDEDALTDAMAHAANGTAWTLRNAVDSRVFHSGAWLDELERLATTA